MTENIRHVVFCEDPYDVVGVFADYKSAYVAWLAEPNRTFATKYMIAPLPRLIDPSTPIIDINE